MPASRKDLPPQLTGVPFTRSEAQSFGVSDEILHGPSVQSLGHGLYLASGPEPTRRQLLAGFLKLLPGGCTAVDGVTALQWWGVDVGTPLPYRFVTTASYRSERQTLRVRRTRDLPPCRDLVVEPVSALVAARTELGLLDLVVAGDWLIHAGRATLAQVRQALTEAKGRDCRKARRAGELVRDRVESPRETRLRLVIGLSGLPEPECNVDLGDEWFFIARVDLYLREWNIAVEYEGDQHRTDSRVYARDLKRYEALAASGVLPVRVAKDHLRHPCEVAWRIFDALMSRGYDGPPPSFGPDWRTAFGAPCRACTSRGGESVLPNR